MTINAAGSNFFQALQVQKNIKLREYNVDSKKIQYTQSLTESYKAAEVDPKPQFPPSHKIDFIA